MGGSTTRRWRAGGRGVAVGAGGGVAKGAGTGGVITLPMGTTGARSFSRGATGVWTIEPTAPTTPPVAPVIDDMPFGEIICALCNGGGDPTRSSKFQGTLRDYDMVTGRFQSVEPVLPVETALRDPQQWNRDAYARNHPLIYSDPDGREVKPLDELALDHIRNTVPEHLRGAIVVGENGMLDKNALNAVETTDANFLDLRTLANLEGVAEVRTAASGPLVGMFVFRSAADTRKDLQQPSVRRSQEPVDSLALSDTTPSSNGAMVTVSDGRHAASSAPAFEHAVTTAHELYVHALRMLQGKSWQHERAEPRGPGRIHLASPSGRQDQAGGARRDSRDDRVHGCVREEAVTNDYPQCRASDFAVRRRCCRGDYWSGLPGLISPIPAAH